MEVSFSRAPLYRFFAVVLVAALDVVTVLPSAEQRTFVVLRSFVVTVRLQTHEGHSDRVMLCSNYDNVGRANLEQSHSSHTTHSLATTIHTQLDLLETLHTQCDQYIRRETSQRETEEGYNKTTESDQRPRKTKSLSLFSSRTHRPLSPV